MSSVSITSKKKLRMQEVQLRFVVIFFFYCVVRTEDLGIAFLETTEQNKCFDGSLFKDMKKSEELFLLKIMEN